MIYYEFVRVSSKLKLTISQINGLTITIEKTDYKREYRRAGAVFQKADGKRYTALLAQSERNPGRSNYTPIRNPCLPLAS